MALIPLLQKDGWEVHYIGSYNGMERSLIEPLHGVTYHGISSGKLRRYFSLKNLTDPFRVLKGAGEDGEKLSRIVRMAREHGGRDNITGVLVTTEED